MIASQSPINIPKKCSELYSKIKDGTVKIPEINIDENVKYAFNETEIIINKPINVVYHGVRNKPLEKNLKGTDKIPGVVATIALNDNKLGEQGYRRIVCLKDGNSAIEEIIESKTPTYFSYKVWNYSLKIGENIEYAKGEWWFTPRDNSTHIRWRYSFKLNKNKLLGKLGSFGRLLFTRAFLKTHYNKLMVQCLELNKHDLEKKIE